MKRAVQTFLHLYDAGLREIESELFTLEAFYGLKVKDVSDRGHCIVFRTEKDADLKATVFVYTGGELNVT